MCIRDRSSSQVIELTPTHLIHLVTSGTHSAGDPHSAGRRIHEAGYKHSEIRSACIFLSWHRSAETVLRMVWRTAYSVCTFMHHACAKNTCLTEPDYTVLARYGTPRKANLWAKDTGQVWITAFKEEMRKCNSADRWLQQARQERSAYEPRIPKPKTTGQAWIRTLR